MKRRNFMKQNVVIRIRWLNNDFECRQLRETTTKTTSNRMRIKKTGLRSSLYYNHIFLTLSKHFCVLCLMPKLGKVYYLKFSIQFPSLQQAPSDILPHSPPHELSKLDSISDGKINFMNLMIHNFQLIPFLSLFFFLQSFLSSSSSSQSSSPAHVEILSSDLQ